MEHVLTGICLYPSTFARGLLVALGLDMVRQQTAFGNGSVEFARAFRRSVRMVSTVKHERVQLPSYPKRLLLRDIMIALLLAVTWLMQGSSSVRAEATVLDTIEAPGVDETAFTKHARPPKTVAPHATFAGAETLQELGQTYLFFVYVLSGEGIDRDKVRLWLEGTMHPNTMSEICADPIIAEKAWYVSYEYADADDIAIASTTISRRDCRRMTEKP
ncbi:hypothetical protein FMN50_04300 [Rhodobacterales bacterium]|nr:hypothetical protein FMN50_04300 [Rhodobacterales bacterium]